MKPDRTCPECGERLSSDAPDGLCPRCLVQQGMALLSSAKPVNGPDDTREASEPLPRATPGAVGLRRFGDYELLGELAHGGMGVVWRARQITLHRAVALKMIRSGHLATTAEVRRFRTEAEAAARLDHPHIVPIYEIGESEGQHYFSMKLVDGGSLGDKIAGQPMPLRRAAALMTKIARAVHYAHQRGILHRDLKPGNILMDSAGEPQLTDFGLAKILESTVSLTQSVSVIGSANYMSPEQAQGQGRQVTTATDVYGLGAVLYEMLTGQPPFSAGSFTEILQAVVDREPVPPSALNAEVDRDLDTICLKCLEKHSQDRYASAEDLALDLEHWLAGETIHARPTTTWERSIKWIRRKPVVAALAASVVFVAAAGLTGVIWQWRKAAERAEALRRNLYASDLSLAHRALTDNNLGRTAYLLNRYLPAGGEQDLRGFEWRYLWQAARGDEQATFVHPAYAEAVAFSPDGRLLATACYDRTIHLWDVTNHQSVVSLDLGREPIRLGGLFFSRDGRHLVARFENGMRLWTTGDWRMATELTNLHLPVLFPPNGKTVLARAAAGGMVSVDVRSEAPRALAGGGFEGFGEFVGLSSDGRWFVSVGRRQEFQVWDAMTRERLGAAEHNLERPTAVSVSSTGPLVAGADWKGRVLLADGRTGRELTNWAAHKTPIYGLCLSPDGRTLATAGFDQLIHLWDLSNYAKRRTLKGHLDEVWGLAFSPDGKLLASTSKDGTAKIWNVEIDQRPAPDSGVVVPIYFTRDGRELYGFDVNGAALRWNLAEHRAEPLVIASGENLKRPSPVAAVSADGTLAAVGSAGGSVHIWSLAHSNLVRSVQAQQSAAGWLGFSADNRMLASASGSSVRVWEIATGLLLQEFQQSHGPVEFAPDGSRLAFCSTNFTIRLWDVKGRHEVARLDAHRWSVWDLAFSPDSRLLLSTSMDATARLWWADTGEPVGLLKGHLEGVTCGTFSPDGRTIATGSTDDTVKLWSAATHHELLTVNELGEDVGSVLFSPDGNTLAIGCFPGSGGRRSIFLLHAPTFAEIEAGQSSK